MTSIETRYQRAQDRALARANRAFDIAIASLNNQPPPPTDLQLALTAMGEFARIYIDGWKEAIQGFTNGYNKPTDNIALAQAPEATDAWTSRSNELKQQLLNKRTDDYWQATRNYLFTGVEAAVRDSFQDGWRAHEEATRHQGEARITYVRRDQHFDPTSTYPGQPIIFI